MSLYTQRHGMRTPVQKTYEISFKAYAVLFDCCIKYSDYLSWKFPEECPDGNLCCGLDKSSFNTAMEFEIPTLFRWYGEIDKPKADSKFDQYALIDFIEYIAQNIRDISRRNYHSYYRHYDIAFSKSNCIARNFMNDINQIFEKCGLLYVLTTNLQVERVEETPILNSQMMQEIEEIKEEGLKDLLQTAINKHNSPYPEDHKDAVEKIWDALERLKTYFVDSNKKQSVERIIQDMSKNIQEYINLFDAEFKALTDIGNDFRIRHHETNKYEISDLRYYDYFFNRCLSLISTAIQFLK